MPVQDTYEAEMDPAFEGQRSDLGLIDIISRAAEGSDIAFGRAVVRGTADDQAQLPSSLNDDFIGVTEYTTAWSETADGLHLYPEYREMNIIPFGRLWVYTETAVVPGDPVYYRYIADTAPLDIVGRFRNDDSGGDAIGIARAEFETTAEAGELARIKLCCTAMIRPPETLTESGEISLKTDITLFDTTAGAIAATLADGIEGQEKTLIMTVDGGTDAVVTPTNLLGFATITLDDAGDTALLRFTNGNWVFVSGSATLA